MYFLMQKYTYEISTSLLSITMDNVKCVPIEVSNGSQNTQRDRKVLEKTDKWNNEN